MASFKLENGQTFNGLAPDLYEKLWIELNDELQLSPAKTTESAAYSAAMVLRVALGLSATAANLSAIVADCRAGRVAVATLRILANAGANCSVLAIHSLKDISLEFEQELKLADHCGVQLAEVQVDEIQDTLDHINNCHALLLGLHNSHHIDSQLMNALKDGINELQTPVHTIESPLGIDVETGLRIGTPIFAATTIALGMPLQGLANAKEYCGRIYLCDVSVPITRYEKLATELNGVFEGQPVVQIFVAE